jgi:hypothetical protein
MSSLDGTKVCARLVEIVLGLAAGGLAAGRFGLLRGAGLGKQNQERAKQNQDRAKQKRDQAKQKWEQAARHCGGRDSHSVYSSVLS